MKAGVLKTMVCCPRCCGRATKGRAAKGRAAKGRAAGREDARFVFTEQ